MCFALLYAAVRSAGAAVPDSLARHVASIYAAARAAALNGIAMCLALLYAAVPSAGADASGQPATMICYTLVYASVCGTGADAAVRLAAIHCHARLFLLRRAALLGTSLCACACLLDVGTHTRARTNTHAHEHTRTRTHAHTRAHTHTHTHRRGCSSGTRPAWSRGGRHDVRAAALGVKIPSLRTLWSPDFPSPQLPRPPSLSSHLARFPSRRLALKRRPFCPPLILPFPQPQHPQQSTGRPSYHSAPHTTSYSVQGHACIFTPFTCLYTPYTVR